MSAISSTGSAGSQVSSDNAFSSIKSSDFIRIMLSELRNQDPFQPQDSSKLLEQLSSLRNIESQVSLQDKLESMVLQNQVSTAGGMIGKLVAGLDDQNNSVVGLVTSVRIQGGKAQLELDSGKSLSIDRVTDIALLPQK